MNTRINNNPSTGHEVKFREGSLVCCTIRFPSSGAILVYDATGSLVGSLPAGTWPFQAWAYIEVSMKVHNTSAFINIWLFGNNSLTADLEISGADTIPVGGTGVCDNIQWAGVEGNTHWIDDWYLMDGELVAIGLGGVIIDAQAPNGDDTTDWTPSTGGTNYNLVDERPFSATDYVSTADDGDIDKYTLAPSSNDDNVFAVRVIGQMKKTDVAIAKARLLIDDGTQGNGATRTLLTTTQVFADTFNAKPSSGDWDATAVNDLLIGVERVAP
jgi:hypothetical protein